MEDVKLRTVHMDGKVRERCDSWEECALYESVQYAVYNHQYMSPPTCHHPIACKRRTIKENYTQEPTTPAQARTPSQHPPS